MLKFFYSLGTNFVLFQPLFEFSAIADTQLKDTGQLLFQSVRIRVLLIIFSPTPMNWIFRSLFGSDFETNEVWLEQKAPSIQQKALIMNWKSIFVALCNKFLWPNQCQCRLQSSLFLFRLLLWSQTSSWCIFHLQRLNRYLPLQQTPHRNLPWLQREGHLQWSLLLN